jgi:hypothetical protein
LSSQGRKAAVSIPQTAETSGLWIAASAFGLLAMTGSAFCDGLLIRHRSKNLRWILIHWFELSTLMLLCLNLWFVSAVLSTLRATNRWLSFLSTYQWDHTENPASANRG